ncbi:Mitochondrial acidic protein mam33 [Vermiconidia calcicola]|uniref:Mitochondrial acidic protein mam33 n=1 Tax=Vermiconidia calcicola TaxID=1690605 RepID=A0ACC3NF62_9PEZI|nr:Mitochondrial acidic protein mam33 [Vermiconidia calcicola]
MLSIRAFARWAPRTTSRIANYTTRTPFRPAARSIPKSTTLLAQRFQPAFSTSARRPDEIGQELGAKLESEISIESENNESTTDSDSNVKTFFDENDFWSVEDKEGEQDVVLKRSYDDEQITVSFSIVDFNTPGSMEGEEADEAFMDEDEDAVAAEQGQSGGANTKGAVNQGKTSGGNMKVAPEDSIAPADREELRNEEDEYNDQSQAFPANVNVLIQRPNRGALRINLVTDNGRFSIHGVTHLPDSNTSPIDLLRNTPENLYTGPPFQQLDEEVQGMLEQYLDVRGINTALALFIPDYIDVKEQKEYLGWLGRVKSFVE